MSITGNPWSRRALLRGAGLAGPGLLLGGAARSAAASYPSGTLHRRGNALFYNGMRIRLRGVALNDPVLSRFDRPVEDLSLLAADWRCNAVRISVYPTTWRHRRAETMRLLERDVEAALANRMFVIVDWHAIGWPDGWWPKAPAWWRLPEDLFDSSWSLAASFWQAVAERWGQDGRVVFELWNELRFHSDDWEAAPGQRWREAKPRLESLLAIVRAKSRNLVLAGGDRYGHDLRGIRTSPLADGNTGYAWHVYAGDDGNDLLPLAHKLDDLDLAHPVVATEWGFCGSCTDPLRSGKTQARFAQEFMRDFLNGRRLSWTAWCWHPVSGPPMLEKDWSTPTAFGRFAKAHLAYGWKMRP
jgi:hypothetical protein